MVRRSRRSINARCGRGARVAAQFPHTRFGQVGVPFARMNARRVVVVAWLVFTACPPMSSTDAGIDAGRDAGSDDERHCRSYAETSCARSIACGNAEPSERANCEALALKVCDSAIGAPSRAGVTRVSPQATASCVEQLTNAPCLFVEGIGSSACLYAPDAHLAAGVIGSPCEGESCLEGTCGPSGTSSCGSCTATAAIGAPCGLCDSRVAFCSNTNVCEAYRDDGANCMRGDQCRAKVCNLSGHCGVVPRGDACRLELECGEQDFCLGLVINQVPGRCQPRTAAGASCSRQEWDSAGGCALGSWCLDNRCVSPAAGSLSEGAECSSHLQCGPSAVCAGLFGVFSKGRCTSPMVGGPCIDDQQFCPPGARCIDTPAGASCRPLRGLSEACTTEDSRWDDCRVGLACGAGQRCEALRSDGRVCSRDAQCLSLHCVNAMCAPPGAPGDRCSVANQCASNRCVFRGNAAGECEASCF